jgi:hypothetical protein
MGLKAKNAGGGKHARILYLAWLAFMAFLASGGAVIEPCPVEVRAEAA